MNRQTDDILGAVYQEIDKIPGFDDTDKCELKKISEQSLILLSNLRPTHRKLWIYAQAHSVARKNCRDVTISIKLRRVANKEFIIMNFRLRHDRDYDPLELIVNCEFLIVELNDTGFILKSITGKIVKSGKGFCSTPPDTKYSIVRTTSF